VNYYDILNNEIKLCDYKYIRYIKHKADFILGEFSNRYANNNKISNKIIINYNGKCSLITEEKANKKYGYGNFEILTSTDFIKNKKILMDMYFKLINKLFDTLKE
jgi:hypothetical protein